MCSENSCPSISQQVYTKFQNQLQCSINTATENTAHWVKFTQNSVKLKTRSDSEKEHGQPKAKNQTLYKNRDASTMLNPEDLGWGPQLATGETAQASAHWWDDARHIRSCLSCPRPEEPGQRAGTTSWTRPLDEGSRRRCGSRTQGIGAAAPGPLGRAEWRWSEETPPPALGSSLICGAALVGLCSGRHLGQGASNWRASFSPDE